MPGNERKVVRGGSWKDIAYFLKKLEVEITNTPTVQKVILSCV